MTITTPPPHLLVSGGICIVAAVTMFAVGVARRYALISISYTENLSTLPDEHYGVVFQWVHLVCVCVCCHGDRILSHWCGFIVHNQECCC